MLVKLSAPLIFLCAYASQTFADPLSAVDWLSDTLKVPQEIAKPETPLKGVSIEPISTTRIGDVQKDTVGLLSSQLSGISADFWGNSESQKLVALIRRASLGQLPEVTKLWRRIVLTEINPPLIQGAPNTLLLARIDYLLNAGDLEPAEAMLKAADPDDPQLFRRWFDISILTQRADAACKGMISNPKFAPTLQARIFCLARAGDWGAAAVTLSTAQALGEISGDEALLLEMFLDPEMFEGQAEPALPTVMTPLTFVMREALVLPRHAQSLPLAFLHMDLQNKAGWKLRITSAERLAREQSIPAATLLDLYIAGQPSASGGIWDRVKSVQSLNQSLTQDDHNQVSTALVNAYQALSPVGLTPALAQWYLEALKDIDLTDAARAAAFELALLKSDALEIAQTMASSNQRDQYIISILTEKYDVPPQGILQSSVSNAFSDTADKTVLHQLVDEGKSGEAVLSALNLLSNGAQSDQGDIETALSVLSYSGFKQEAKNIAAQILISMDAT